MNGRLPSWHATGLVEKAWKRITPPTREALAERMGVEGSDLSARNTSTDEKPKRMTLAYAERIAVAVRQDDPTFTVADLAAPEVVVGEVHPTLLHRLAAGEEESAELRAILLQAFALLDLELAPATPGRNPEVRRVPRVRGRGRGDS